jgi:hypothetical protein
MSLGTPVADSSLPVDALPSIEADMAVHPETRLIHSLPIPRCGTRSRLGREGKGVAPARPPNGPVGRSVPPSPRGARVAWGGRGSGRARPVTVSVADEQLPHPARRPTPTPLPTTSVLRWRHPDE